MQEVMCLPKCPEHKDTEMLLRTRTSYEQDYCGVWYECPKCSCSTLLMSDELKKIYGM